MEMPVTLITWRRDKGLELQWRVTGPGPKHCVPPSWVGRQFYDFLGSFQPFSVSQNNTFLLPK